MKPNQLFLVLLVLAHCAQVEGKDPPDIGKEFYELPPGTTYELIQETFGEPNRHEGGSAIYDLTQGYVKLAFQSGYLKRADHFDPGEGAVSRRIYDCDPEAAFDKEGKRAREALLKNKEYKEFGRFYRSRVSCAKHTGDVYMLEDGYVVECRDSRFVSSLVLHRDGEREVLYRAIDEWDKLKPKDLTTEEMGRRMKLLNDSMGALKGMRVEDTLGRPDWVSGSGIQRLCYYIDGGVIELIELKGMITNVWFWIPGEPDSPALADWLGNKQQAEQVGAEQPATAPEAKSEGSEKPKPESEGRPQ